MKRFLSILLALAVGFTFTFGSAMSAFGTAYTNETAKAVLDAAYQGAVATAFDVDYDTIDDADNNAANELTVFTVDKAAVQAGIYAAYQAAITTIATNSIAGVAVTDDTNKAKDTALVRVALESAATVGGANVNDTYEAAFDAYKAHLVSIVNAISTEAYTTTSYEDLGVEKFTAKNGNKYTTSKEAAEADKQWALDAIAKAKFAGVGADNASTTAEWNTTYANLYTKVFGEVFEIVLHKDDVIDPAKVTSISYAMKNEAYSTAAAEKGAAATLEVKKAEAKAKLVSVITTFETGATYKASYANAVEAYKEAMTYLIDNAVADPTGLIGAAITEATTTSIKIDAGNLVDYVAISADAARAKADAANNKQTATIQDSYYDDAKADAALVEVLMQIYGGQNYDSETQTANGKILYKAIASITEGRKAVLKAARDYSEIKPSAEGTYTFETYNTGAKENAVYYAKEFEAVKAAVDAYCAAVDAAKTQLDIDKAEEAFKEATLEKVIAKKATVDAIFDGYENDMLAAYWTKVKGTTPEIYVTWDEGKTYKTEYDHDDFKAYVIAKGARTTKEADALYADACAIIDAYKTKAQFTAAAADVQAMIAALPTTVTLADKAAVIAAYDAYVAVAEGFRPMIANASKLKTAVAAVERLEAAEVIKLINALPALSKITVADKAAVKAASEARDAWADEDAYKDNTMVNPRTTVADLEGYLGAVKNAELQAINDAYAPLAAKYAVDKLTVEDATAISALQVAVAAYIAEYSEAVACEAELNQMAAVVEALAVYTEKDVKSFLQDATVKASSTVDGKKVTVTAKADVQELIDNGYTVEFKFFKSKKASSGYKSTVTKNAAESKTYTNTKASKGANYYKYIIIVTDAEGNEVAKTTLKECAYAKRTIK